MRLSYSLAVEVLMAVLVTQAAAAPTAQAHHIRSLEPRAFRTKQPDVGATCSDGWCRSNPAPVHYGRSKPPPKGGPKGKFLGKREVVDEDAAVVEKRAGKSVYDTGIGGTRPHKPSTVTIPNSKPAPKPISTKPKPAPKPATKPTKPRSKRDVDA